MREQLEIIEYERDRRLVIEGGFGAFHGRAIYDLEGSATTTDLVNAFELEAGAPSVLGGLATRGIAAPSHRTSASSRASSKAPTRGTQKRGDGRPR
ncbi:hypothetical protein ACFQX6_31415 [Streptosporangium lutulentum]